MISPGVLVIVFFDSVIDMWEFSKILNFFMYYKKVTVHHKFFIDCIFWLNFMVFAFNNLLFFRSRLGSFFISDLILLLNFILDMNIFIFGRVDIFILFVFFSAYRKAVFKIIFFNFLSKHHFFRFFNRCFWNNRSCNSVK